MSVRALTLGGLALSLLMAHAPADAADRIRAVGLVWNSLPQNDLDAGNAAHPGPKAIEEALARLGWAVGKDLRLVSKSAEGRYERMPEIIDAMVRLPVEVLVVFGPEAARAAQERTTTVPIVWAGSHLLGATSSPTGNLTGTTYVQGPPGTGAAKRLELLKTIAPRASRVAVFLHQEPGKPLPLPSETVMRASAHLGLKFRLFGFMHQEGLDLAFEQARRWGADSAYMSVFPALTWSRPLQLKVIGLSKRHRWPTIYEMPALAQAGGLIAHGHDDVVGQSRAAYFIDRLLRGARPAELPVEQVSTVQMTINRSTARDLGLQVPQTLLVSADRLFD
ncbi:MAG TPA: ABC transporter substrate-binding protein [Usitatibacter sp.]|nr:ABC transporter substrate-binding protein [Usitatibacter sp.]